MRPLLLLLLLLASFPTLAVDAANGRKLVDENCFSCHDTSLYTRPNRRVNDLAALRKQVQRCELTLELQWFDEQIDDVVAHLNQAFYKFGN
jgi:hypothetical protein